MNYNARFENITTKLIKQKLELIDKENDATSLSKKFLKRFRNKYNRYTDNAIIRIFENIPKETKILIKKYIFSHIEKDVDSKELINDAPYTIIAFSGFGIKELTPSLC
jgi:hypothetical protein